MYKRQAQDTPRKVETPSFRRMTVSKSVVINCLSRVSVVTLLTYSWAEWVGPIDGDKLRLTNANSGNVDAKRYSRITNDEI